MAQDQELLWMTKGQKAASKEHLDPHSLYDFFSNANAARLRQGRPVQRIKSAAPRIGGSNHDANTTSSSVRSHLGSFTSLRNPSPTPATSRPLSSRSGISSVSSQTAQKPKAMSSHSPSSLYFGFHKARCRSAPPKPTDYYLPQRPKTAKSRVGSAVSSSRSAPKRAWQNRTSSAKSQHSLLSRDEVDKRHKERCKSAPLPYDFSSIEVVNSVPEEGSDIQRLKAFTRPLTCMPDVVQNVLSHNGLRHCCSAYQLRPKTVFTSRQQFWPVARPAVFHRGDVPKYLHFVKPAGFWIKGEEIRPRTAPDGRGSLIGDHNDISATSGLLLQGEDDNGETILYEEQFLIPAVTTSEGSLSDQEELAALRVDELQPAAYLDASPIEDFSDKDLNEDREVGEQNSTDHATPDATPGQGQEDTLRDNQTPESADHEQGIKVVITKVDSPVRSPSPEETQTEPVAEIPNDEKECDLEIVVPEIPQWAAEEEVSPVEEEKEEEEVHQGTTEQDVVPRVNREPQVPMEPLEPVKRVPDEPPKELVVTKERKVEEVKAQINQVKFADSLVLTSYKSPQLKKEEKEQPVKPVSILKPAVTKVETPSPELKAPPAPERNVTPAVERKVPDKLLKVKPPVKPVKEAGGKAEKKEEEKSPESELKVAQENMEEPPKLEPDVLPRPEYIKAPGAYRMYYPKDLLDHHLEQKRESRPVRKSVTSTTTAAQFKPSSESAEVMTTVLDEQKRRREGMKPWLQGRLALSKQTSRFELPMDVRLLEAMTPMEYLTKYCIISTRRKALYKHIFQKVDRDRDSMITFKEVDRGLREIHVDSITTEQIKKLIEMVEGNEKSTFNLAQFSAVAAFSERLLFSETQVTEKNSAYSSKEVIEEADFCGLKYKLDRYPVNPNVRRILEVL